MTAEAVLTVSSTVVALTQFAKWSGIDDKHGPLMVMILSLIGVSFWGWSQGDFHRATAFMYFAGWASVTLSAAGVFGFTRAAAEAVVRTLPPPNGAGASSTLKT